MPFVTLFVCCWVRLRVHFFKVGGYIYWQLGRHYGRQHAASHSGCFWQCLSSVQIKFILLKAHDYSSVGQFYSLTKILRRMNKSPGLFPRAMSQVQEYPKGTRAFLLHLANAERVKYSAACCGLFDFRIDVGFFTVTDLE